MSQIETLPASALQRPSQETAQAIAPGRGAQLAAGTATISRLHLVGVGCGASFLLCYLVGLWLLSGFVPAHPPSGTAQDIARVYQGNPLGIQTGMVFVMLAAAFYLPWTVTLSALVKRMEGDADFLAPCQLIGGVASSMFFVLPALFWQVAAFRPERDPALLLLLNDIGWILTVTPVPPFLVQFLPLGFAMLADKRTPPVMPRWMGYTTLWSCVLYLPGAAAYFFKLGPFAWNGLFAFWVPLSVFVAWEIGLLCLAFKHIDRSPAKAP